jgi:hypothetical protein
VLLRYEIFVRYAFFGKLLQFDLRFLRQTYESWHIDLHKTKFHRRVFTGTETRTHRRVTTAYSLCVRFVHSAPATNNNPVVKV